MISFGRSIGFFSRSCMQPIAQIRNVSRIPHWENHIRFDPRFGRKRPCQDVLDRFKRLNNGLCKLIWDGLYKIWNRFMTLQGMWIRAQPGRHVKRYQKDDVFAETAEDYLTCTKEECMMLDKMMTPFWLRPKHYVDDPYEPYNVRHGLTSPRVDDSGRFVRERRKILLEDSVADKYFMDR